MQSRQLLELCLEAVDMQRHVAHLLALGFDLLSEALQLRLGNLTCRTASAHGIAEQQGRGERSPFSSSMAYSLIFCSYPSIARSAAMMSAWYLSSTDAWDAASLSCVW